MPQRGRALILVGNSTGDSFLLAYSCDFLFFYAKCSATKQALPNTTDAEVGKPEAAKEVGGRK
jgi:hypothetical protein